MRIIYLLVCGVVLAGLPRAGIASVAPTIKPDGSPITAPVSLNLGPPNGGESARNAALGSGLPFSRPSKDHGDKVLYAFKGSPDGQSPIAGLTNVNGEFYGTTAAGGTAGAGTVFNINTSGRERVLYSFKGSPDGYAPGASLLAANGALYGTTEVGGGGTCGSAGLGCGTVFDVTTSGKETVLHRFKGTDGAIPISTPVLLNGKLYGTTQSGGGSTCPSGTAGCGNIFELSESGKFRVLHRFTGTPDGSNPYAGLIALNGALYGTTFGGGTVGQGYGTVIEVNISGGERAVYSFNPGNGDGESLVAEVIAVNGKLYGTTTQSTNGQGIVFEVSPSGKERVLYNFIGGADGGMPQASLIAVNGALYGTTVSGGVFGQGTVFKVTLSGKESVLHSFVGGSDGASPYGSLISLNGALYGTTASGGIA